MNNDSLRGTTRLMFGIILSISSVANLMGEYSQEWVSNLLMFIIGVSFILWGLNASKDESV